MTYNMQSEELAQSQTQGRKYHPYVVLFMVYVPEPERDQLYVSIKEGKITVHGR